MASVRQGADEGRGRGPRGHADRLHEGALLFVTAIRFPTGKPPSNERARGDTMAEGPRLSVPLARPPRVQHRQLGLRRADVLDGGDRGAVHGVRAAGGRASRVHDGGRGSASEIIDYNDHETMNLSPYGR